ncbi:urease accessory protein UreF [Hyphomicrobium sp.]|uniref:urease accessory protein UreF n=1 Tax=Hyphomicrobium sp. TaxID=82 RepID=UPI002D767738|nr:urease accessory protein UreF [Hyphomicrobium sp.]HET6389232.1 urease accessory protein UreF [Hyphomicrobium sp.]
MTIIASNDTSTITDLTDSYRRLPEVLHLLQFGDSALPVGAFSFSNGLESAIQQNIVCDAESLREFVLTVMHQSATSDGVALLCAHRAAKKKDRDALIEIDRATFERKLNEETRLMTVRMGRKLTELADAIMMDGVNHAWMSLIKRGQTPGTHPVSLAIALAAVGVDARDAFGVQQYGIATTILGAALRLMRLSFVDTQKILLDATGTVAPAYEEVASAELNDMASFLPMVDILAAVHVKGHVRMFMN